MRAAPPLSRAVLLAVPRQGGGHAGAFATGVPAAGKTPCEAKVVPGSGRGQGAAFPSGERWFTRCSAEERRLTGKTCRVPPMRARRDAVLRVPGGSRRGAPCHDAPRDAGAPEAIAHPLLACGARRSRRAAMKPAMRILLLCLLALLSWPAAAAELKIATWNIAWLTTKPAGHPDLPRGFAPRSEQDFARLRAYAERLAADVVAIQEVDGPLAAARVFDATRWEFHFPAETDTQRAGFAWRRGLNVTRNPDVSALDLVPNARRSLRRGADITVRQGDGPPLRLLSVHLDGGCARDSVREPNSRDCQNLGRQAEILRDWIAERRREGVAFAILGDFNRRMDRDDDFLAVLTEAAPLTRPTEGFANPCWVRDGQGRAFIDHILLGGPARDWLVRDSFRVLVYAERDIALRDRISDHCPISVRLDPR